MAFARDIYTATAGQTNFSITFPFLEDAHIDVFVDGTEQTEGSGNDYTISSSAVVFNSGLTGGEIVVLERSSSQSSRLVNYSVPSTLTESDLDTDSLQAFYMVQESIDIANQALNLDATENWDAESKLIKNVSDPTEDDEAVNRGWVNDNFSDENGNVPAPDNADADKILQATGSDAYDWGAKLAVPSSGDAGKVAVVNSGEDGYEPATASTARSNLGLGTAAVESMIADGGVVMPNSDNLSSLTDMGEALSNLGVSPGITFATIGTASNSGAVGDGAADDTSALQALIDELSAAGGGVLEGLHKTYRVDSTLTLKANVELRNFDWDFSNAADVDVMLEASGSKGSDLSLSSGASPGNRTLSLSAVTGLAQGDYIELFSDEDTFSGTTTAFHSEMHRIRSISGTTVTLDGTVLHNYSTGDNGRVRKLNFVEGVVLRGCTAVGKGASDSDPFDTTGAGNQTGAQLDTCLWPLVVDCSFDLFRDAGVRFIKCWGATARNTSVARAVNGGGTSYGVVPQDGSHYTSVVDCIFEDLRHGVTLAGSDGMIRYTVVRNCRMYGMFNAGAHSHAVGEYYTIEGNEIWMAGDGTGVPDGIVGQTPNMTVRHNLVVTAPRHGIFITNLQTDQSTFEWWVHIEGNEVRSPGQSSSLGRGIYVLSQANLIGQISIIGNRIGHPQAQGIYVYFQSGDAREVVVASNTIRKSGGSAIHLQNDAGATIKGITITGNTSQTNDDSVHHYRIQANSSGDISQGTIVGNQLFNGSDGINGNFNESTIVGNTIRGYTGGAVNVTATVNTTANNTT